jgi:cysteinyl-tRNA synthetase
MLMLYNTLTRQKEPFVPLVPGKVKMYSCGPTVYDYAHIGNLRAYIVVDILKRHLKYSGLDVRHVMNITDVDDKTIKRSREQGMTLREFTEKYAKEFFSDLGTLNIEKADSYPRATSFIKDMEDMIMVLVERGIAYKSDDGSVYFSVSKFPGYGRLSGLENTELKAGARVAQDAYEKGEARDFALWKAWGPDDGDVFWNTEFGKGRPGWHIECSVMSMKYLGKHFDIHTGGVDLIFPHHENEIAQSEAATRQKFVNYWVHNEHLMVDGKKMSKSLGNFYTLRDLLEKGYSPKAIRYILLATHYRQQLNFTMDGIISAGKAVERLMDFIRALNAVNDHEKYNEQLYFLAERTKKAFRAAMDDDLNTPEALAVVFSMIGMVYKAIEGKDIGFKNALEISKMMKEFDRVLGLMKEERTSLDGKVEGLIKKREEARKKKDFATSDAIRDQLGGMGIILEDSAEGVKWKRKV